MAFNMPLAAMKIWGGLNLIYFNKSFIFNFYYLKKNTSELSALPKEEKEEFLELGPTEIYTLAFTFVTKFQPDSFVANKSSKMRTAKKNCQWMWTKCFSNR